MSEVVERVLGRVRVLSDFFPPTLGSLGGRCVVCGRVTERGHPVRFSDNFTAWSLLHGGNVVCEYCKTMLDRAELRRRSWVAYVSDGGERKVEFLERGRVLEALLNPPGVPFAFYLTRTGKKQGFLQLVNRLSLSRERYYAAFDDLLVYVERKRLTCLVGLAKRALESGLRKGELLHGCGVRSWRYEELCREIERVRGDPLWQVVVWAL